MEVVVAKQGVVETAGLAVRATFQPSRTAKASLAQAYDWLLPISHGSLKSNREKGPRKESIDEQKASSDLRASELRKAG
jgi:hypothetical protein